MVGNRQPRRRDGFNLVILAVMFTVIGILTANALPKWSTQIQRDKEEELIFRGLQYAEAIRVFKQKYNRPPVRLKELIEVEPRTIRQLWNNPLSEEAAGKPPQAIGWDLIFEGRPGCGELGPQNGEGGIEGLEGNAGSGLDDSDEDDPIGFDGFADSREDKVEEGPILGVCSKVGDTAIKTFCDTDSIQQWRFEERLLLPIGAAIGGGNAVPTKAAPINASLIGRPWPGGIKPPLNMGSLGCSANQRPAPNLNRQGRDPNRGRN